MFHLKSRFGHGASVVAIVAHRHFQLSADEVMLETQEQNCSVAKPIKLCELKKIRAVPNIIALGKDHQWYPVNYGRSNLFLLCN